jgi:hypothetical protein
MIVVMTDKTTRGRASGRNPYAGKRPVAIKKAGRGSHTRPLEARSFMKNGCIKARRRKKHANNSGIHISCINNYK